MGRAKPARRADKPTASPGPIKEFLPRADQCGREARERTSPKPAVPFRVRAIRSTAPGFLAAGCRRQAIPPRQTSRQTPHPPRSQTVWAATGGKPPHFQTDRARVYGAGFSISDFMLNGCQPSGMALTAMETLPVGSIFNSPRATCWKRPQSPVSGAFAGSDWSPPTMLDRAVGLLAASRCRCSKEPWSKSSRRPSAAKRFPVAHPSARNLAGKKCVMGRVAKLV